jgi:hypothetical protein
MEFGSLLIIGAVVSLLVQAIKKYIGTSEWWTLAVVVVISILGGFVYYAWGTTPYWQSFVEVLTTAGGIYTYIIHRFEKPVVQ